MRIGLSLPPAYLVRDHLASDAPAAWHTAFGDADTYLEALYTAGVTAIELRSIAEDADPSTALRAAQRVWDAGMGLTVHGRLPRAVSGDTLGAIYPSLISLVSALRAREDQSILTLHCYSAPRGDVRQLAECTARALHQMLDVFQREHVPLRIALENNHVSAPRDPGLTYAGILDMIDSVDYPQIGACWDVGHAFMNVQHGQMEQFPGDGFLRRVIHTHLHDLGPRTHFPLTYGVVPLDRYLDLLFDCGYSGILNLELSPERFPDAVQAGVWDSIERLVAYRHRRTRSGGSSHGQGDLARG